MYVGIDDWVQEPPVYMNKSMNGVAEAHKGIVRRNYDQPQITIFEDDIIFTSPHSWRRYLELYRELPSDWQVYLGGHYNFKKRTPQTENLNRLQWQFSGAHHYTIRKSFYDKFLECENFHIDRWIGQNNAICYAPKLLLSRQMGIEENGQSERTGKPVTYSKFHKRLTYYTHGE
jgi:GR25 family glycosyltransferase involved in LPS biosynthesis